MVCKKCGAHLLEDDQFCPECGAKVIRKKRCPECGEVIREGTRFCPGCGAEVGEARSVKRTDSESAPRRREDSEETPRKRSSSDTAPRKKANPAPPPKKRPVPREEPRRRRDWEDDWDDDDDDDDDEESVDVLTIMTVAVGCILLVIVAVLGFNLYQRYVPKNYDKVAEEQEEDDQEGEGEEVENGQSLEEQQEDGWDEELVEDSSEAEGTLVTTADVNIRDNPGTQGTNVIMKTKKGTSYEYIEAVEGGSWYMILLTDVDGHEYGYVSADYVEIQ